MKTKTKLIHNSQEVLKYWNQDNIESMYDKNLLSLEIRLIKKEITGNSKILDAGCGEGEGTLEYSKIPGVKIHAVDFSETRLNKAALRLKKQKNVLLKKVDFLGKHSLDQDYDFIVSQRFLINLMEWELQKKVLLDFKSILKKGGKLILLEGSVNGVNSLNNFRKLFGLKPIPVRWHNLFLDDKVLIKFMKSIDMELIGEDGLGEYFILTRGLQPYFKKELNWNSKFNKIAGSSKIQELLSLGPVCSRLKLWIFEKV
ncbi:hypothetical protein A3D83_01280 [Candidatus Daviesbacteria bacterium RIFCSPHIGHO2_02_FULL_41_10]|uniref:Methyltransferase domain-containing protein n=1 Tax=Candidatus Daviesbacteria bacterium RIFCSPHIGHO2_02_FULL_41_10 TaxID=1797774 RepID=A0A1F5JY47_9BACT|nr:MAG: hypothetical protein A3D83_01280 [Candidatus Daviesbacteria bacterium RIFCSPHIGHO2_02_FULL_41_10]